MGPVCLPQFFLLLNCGFIGPASASIQQGQLANLTRPTNQAARLALKIALSPPPCSVVVGPKSQQAELVV